MPTFNLLEHSSNNSSEIEDTVKQNGEVFELCNYSSKLNIQKDLPNLLRQHFLLRSSWH
jgi:hypothetical protein